MGVPGLVRPAGRGRAAGPYAERTGMEEQVLGTTFPVLSICLDPGESVVAETGEFSWMTDSIQMSTGSSLFLSTYTAKDAPGTIAFAAKLPGSIMGTEIGPGTEYLVHRHGFLAGTPGIEISAGFQQPFSTGIFAGEDFVLQRIGGQGRAWIELAGQVVSYDLAPGVAAGASGARGDVHGFGLLPGHAGARHSQPVLRRRRASLRGAVRAGLGVAAVDAPAGAGHGAG